MTTSILPPLSLQFSSAGDALSWGDLELLHHFSTSTYISLARRVTHYPMWQVSIPTMAFQNPFLMHSVFAISALHLAYLHPERQKELALSASKHQHIALQSFRVILQDSITKESCHAVFACSILLAACSMGSLQCPGFSTADSTESSDVVPEWMSLLRGVYT